jgi:hypothetical protein
MDQMESRGSEKPKTTDDIVAPAAKIALRQADVEPGIPDSGVVASTETDPDASKFHMKYEDYQ